MRSKARVSAALMFVGWGLLSVAACSEQAQPDLGMSVQAATFPNVTDWSPLLQAGIGIGDVSTDGANNGREIVGDAANPAIFIYNDGIDFFIRMRLDDDPTGGGQAIVSPFGWGIVLDTNNDLSAYEYLLIVDGTGPDTIRFRENTTQGNLGDPNDTAETEHFSELANDGVGGNIAISLAGSTFGGDADFFLDFAVPVAVLTAQGIDLDSRLRIIGASSNNGASLSLDIGGCDSGAGSCTLTDAASDPVSLNGCGDGNLDAGEGCDDANTILGDGCNLACEIESGTSCNADTNGAIGDASCASGTCDISGGAPGICAGAVCGDNILGTGEGCDDGNQVDDGNGCEADCFVSTGSTCNSDPSGETGDASCASGLCDVVTDTCLLPDGEVCTANAECLNTCIGGTCAGEAGPGGTCDTGDNADCSGAGLCDGGTDTCLLPDGEVCTANAECVNTCIGGTCAGPAGTGGSCDTGDNADCSGAGLCDGATDTCLLPDGEVCTANAECVNTCIGGTCAGEAAPGGSCDTGDNGDCSGAGLCDGATDTCLLPDGEVCTANAECLNTCIGGSCTGPAGPGGTCDTGDNADCSPGLSCSDVNVCDTDLDGDGVLDSDDLDDDNDGIPDSVEGNGDADGDGIPNHRDLDSDNDGISDLVESGHDGLDADGDAQVDGAVGTNGLADELETAVDSGIWDANSDTVGPDTLLDTDADNVADVFDLDSDNDGLSDLVEAGYDPALIDTNNDGEVDDSPDADRDGIQDGVDGDSINFGDDDSGFVLPAQDGGSPDYLDTDSDNDGLFDIDEAGLGGLDADDDGDVDGSLDLDGDGILDTIDDSDLDGTPDDVDPDPQGFAGLGAPDTDGDGIPNSVDLDDDNDGIPDLEEGSGDSDGDGVPNQVDLDSDNDGIDDATESGLGCIDTSPDNGVCDGPFGANGLADDIETGNESGEVGTLLDSDGDGDRDFVDLDSDGDGEFDLDETGSSVLDSDSDGRVDGVADADGDGILDEVDADDNSFGFPDVSAENSDADGDGIPDPYDVDDAGPGPGDSNEDGLQDDEQCPNPPGWPACPDEDDDGTPDYLEDFDGEDFDGDGVPDSVDLDDDNDGIPDELEGDGDFDNDGLPNHLDLDSDGDGIFDNEESGHGAEDEDNDGQLDCPSGVGANGLCDDVESDPESGIVDTPFDTDSDGNFDFLDLDSDDDTILDSDEASPSPLTPPDTDGDGTPDYRDTDSDDDGLDDEVEAGDDDLNTAPVDTDEDGEPDYRDPDSDNDTVPDGEDGVEDPDGDGLPNFRDPDSNGDGIQDGVYLQGGGCSASGGAPGHAWFLLILLALTLRVRRRRFSCRA